MPEIVKISAEDLPKHRWVEIENRWPVIVAYDNDGPVRSNRFEERIKKRGRGMEEYRRPIGQPELGGIMRYYPAKKRWMLVTMLLSRL